MKLYDDIISEWQNSLIRKNKTKVFNAGEQSPWPECSDRMMILRSDMAYELGGNDLPAIGCTVITTDPSFVPGNRIHVIGPELNEISQDTPYARIAIVRVKEEELGNGDVLYHTIRKLEYTRYHFYPEGFMMRVSAMTKREAVRVSKKSLKDGMTFAKVGSRMINAFLKQKCADAVNLYFITDPEFDYQTLKKQTQAAEDITKTIDHIFKDLKMDCNVCSLQKICEEVEGLKEMHFAKSQS